MAATSSGSFSLPSPQSQAAGSSTVKIDPAQNTVTVGNQPIAVTLDTTSAPLNVTIAPTPAGSAPAVVNLGSGPNAVTDGPVLAAVQALVDLATIKTPVAVVESTISVPFAQNASNPTATFAVPAKCFNIRFRNVSPLMLKVTLVGADGAITIPFSGSEDIERLGSTDSAVGDTNYSFFAAGKATVATVGNSGAAMNTSPPQLVINFRSEV